MSLLKKFFKPSNSEKSEAEGKLTLSVDQLFVHNFIENGGKFLYCTSVHEALENLAHITTENQWEYLACIDEKLLTFSKALKVQFTQKLDSITPLFTNCEYLIAEDGSILFSSNQIKEFKISELSKDFIVFAKTSQLVSSKTESLKCINASYQEKIPTNISAVKNFNPSEPSTSLTSNKNSKNLYLLLIENL